MAALKLVKPYFRRHGCGALNAIRFPFVSSAPFIKKHESQHGVHRLPIEHASKLNAPRFLHLKSGTALDEPLIGLRTFARHNDEKILEVTWCNDDTQKYSYPWLRDNCRCESCYSSSTYSRSVSFLDLDVEADPREVNLSADGGTLTITWPDGHRSEYASSWLKENRFINSADDPVFHPKMKYWGCDFEKSLRVFELREILESYEALYEMLVELKASGLCRITGCGTEEGQVKKLADRISFLHTTFFGDSGHVKVLPNSTHVSTTSKHFPMHTDLSYKGRPPGLLILHCIEQAKDEGGENWFTDGFRVALDLKESDPEAYDILCNVPMEFKDTGTYHFGEFYQRSCHPTIGLDRRGHPNHIYLSDHGREPMLRIPPEDVLPVYRALKKFSNIYHHPNNVYVYKLQEGDIMFFDNRRVIHGRAEFASTEGNSRDLELGYLEWDEVDSRIRILMKKLSKKKEEIL